MPAHRRPLLFSLALLPLATGCEVASLPPASSRDDGGPVARRGVVSHETRSYVRLYQDPNGCTAVQTVNRGYRVVTLRDRVDGVGGATGFAGSRAPGGPATTRPVVLEEAYDVRRCLDRRGASSEATVTAWEPDGGATDPLFRIRGRAMRGEVVGNLYRMTSRSCCGSRDLAIYYSLLTGRALFSSSITPLSLRAANGTSRFLAVHDSYSAAAPPESLADSTVVGVLQWGDDREPATRIALVTEQPGMYEVRRLVATLGRNPTATTPDSIQNPAGSDPDGVLVELVERGAGRLATIRVPLVNGAPQWTAAIASAGFRLRSAR